MSEAPWPGPCCACGQYRQLRNVMMLTVRGLVPGTGWGCVLCGLPADGAVAVVCDECVGELDEIGLPKKMAEIRWACARYPSDEDRIDRAVLTEPFDHDRTKHAEELDAWEAFRRSRSGGSAPADGGEEIEDLDFFDGGEDLPGDTDKCRYVEPVWKDQGEDEDLHKCAGCNRFFLQPVPIGLFIGEGENMLYLEVCDNCAPKVLARVSRAGS